MKVIVKSLLNGLMVYWDENLNAARYYVHLLIGDKHRDEVYENGRMTTKYGKETFQEIALVEVERNTKYHSFINLAKIDQLAPSANSGYRMTGIESGLNYYVVVEAEDKAGIIIDKSSKLLGKVYTMVNGYYSLENY